MSSDPTPPRSSEPVPPQSPDEREPPRAWVQQLLPAVRDEEVEELEELDDIDGLDVHGPVSGLRPDAGPGGAEGQG